MAHALIAGSGIGGLTAALALREQGWTVDVYERASALESVGAGLAVAPNALRALDVLGVGDEIRGLAAFGEAPAGVRRYDGTWLIRTDQREAERRWGDLAVVLPRAALVAALAERLDDGVLHFGVEVEGVDAERGKLATSEGAFEADLVVAADGVRSVLRSAIFPDHSAPVYSGETTWRAILDDVPMEVGGVEYWGPGGVIATMPLAGGAVYMYAAALAPAGASAGDERQALLDLFGGWTTPIPELLARLDPGAVLRNDVYHLPIPLPAFHSGRVAVLGDAAHAMTPHLGQGACQAVEDAVVLAHEATHGGDWLEGYTRARLPRTAMIVKESMSVMRVSLTPNRLAAGLRDTALRVAARVAPRMGLRRFDPIFSWEPPRS